MANRKSEMKHAVALAYGGDGAPKVVAKGAGVNAEAIIAVARESGVYVHQSAELVGLLMQVNLDDEIPPQLYQGVAELLAWLYQMDARCRSRREKGIGMW